VPLAPSKERWDGDTVGDEGDISVHKKPVEMTADDLADEEWGPVKTKAQARKKSKIKESRVDQAPGTWDGVLIGFVMSLFKNTIAVEGELISVQIADAVPLTTAEAEADAPEEGGTKILSKKEKEKLKKEREKVRSFLLFCEELLSNSIQAKKKAQATAKKVTEEGNDVQTTVMSVAVVAPELQTEEVDDEGEEAGAGKTDPKKKKKKKAKKDEEPSPAPPVGAKKKGGISALKALLEEKKRIEEEAKRREDEEKRRVEEEERKAEEEQRRKEEEKQRKKEKEKVSAHD
jgi:translation initiation factor 5B